MQVGVAPSILGKTDVRAKLLLEIKYSRTIVLVRALQETGCAYASVYKYIERYLFFKLTPKIREASKSKIFRARVPVKSKGWQPAVDPEDLMSQFKGSQAGEFSLTQSRASS